MKQYDNKTAVEGYHKKLETLYVRVPAANAEQGIPDYPQMIRDRAKELGFINQKGVTKGEGSINAYILNLIEKDMGTTIIKGMTDLKK